MRGRSRRAAGRSAAHTLRLLAALLSAAAPVHAQAVARPDSAIAAAIPEARRPRVGVVLSGGSARGLAHIGVLRVLEQAGVPVDVVTGTSMGALIGGLYAIGYSTAGLHTIATTLDWPFYFQDAPRQELLGADRRLLGTRTLISFPVADGRLGLPGGLVAGQRVSALLARLTWPVQTERDFRAFPIPFAAVATDLATRDVVVLDQGSLAPSLRASMSLPGLFTPVRADGRLLTDGGIARNLPAQEARALGADIVVCSDVSDSLSPTAELQSLTDVLLQTIVFQVHASTLEQRRLCDVYIQPDQDGLRGLSFDRAAEWIARGEQAAAAELPRLRAIAARATPVARAPGASWTTPPEHPVPVRAVLVEGVPPDAERVIHRVARLQAGTPVTPDMLEAAVERVYATGLFERVGYRLDPAPAAIRDGAGDGPVVVVLQAELADEDRVGFGFRFDDRYKASLLFTATLRNRVGFGSTTQLQVRLGEQLRLGAQFLRAGIADSRLVVGGTGSFTRTPLDIFEGRQRVAEAAIESSSLSALVGTTLGAHGLAALQLEGELASASMAIAARDTATSQSFYGVAAVVSHEVSDRPSYPSRGSSIYARAEHALGEARFTHYLFDASVIVPVTARLSLLGRTTVGAAFGGAQVPLHRRFHLGGVNSSPIFRETQLSFAGLQPQEISGAAVERIGAGAQWAVRPDVFATARLDAGTAGDQLRFAVRDYHVGAALSLGLATPFGPVELSASSRALRQRPRFEVNVGHAF